MIDSMFDNTKQQHRNSTGDEAGEPLEDYLFTKSGFIQSIGPCDHRDSKLLKK